MKPRELLKSYRQSKAFHAMVPVTCFANDHVFMTRHGDCGLALRITGVDDECLTDSTLDALSDALMAAFKQFDERFRIYQYLIKRTGVEVPRKRTYPSEAVERVIQDRVGHIEQNAALGKIELTLVIVYETRFGSKRSRPVKMSTGEMREEMAGAIDTLLAQSQSFATRVSNPFAVRLLNKQEVFLFLRELLNLDAKKARRSR